MFSKATSRRGTASDRELQKTLTRKSCVILAVLLLISVAPAGRSQQTSLPHLRKQGTATQLILGRLWNTFLLSFTALIIAWGIAVPLGIWAAVKKDTWVDRLCSFIAVLGLSIPDVLLALLALVPVAYKHWRGKRSA